MNISDVFLGCFAFGLLWSLAAVLLGGLHFDNHAGHSLDLHFHPTHFGINSADARCGVGNHDGWSQDFFSLHTFAIFLAWMGGCGYLMVRHTRFGIWIVLALSSVVGLAGGTALGFAMRFLHGREFAMHAADYDMIGVLGRISSPIRQGGTGEMIFTRDGSRQLASVRSEGGTSIERGQEVVVTSYGNGIAYVRTWDALTGSDEPTKSNGRDQDAGAEDAPLTR